MNNKKYLSTTPHLEIQDALNNFINLKLRGFFHYCQAFAIKPLI